MLHANCRCNGKCSLSLKFAILALLVFGTIYLVRTAFRLRSSAPSFVAITLLTDIPQPKSDIADTCQPKSNIFFLKTHKCASSTVQNILLRYGYRRNLNFVLPSLGNYLGNQSPFHRSMAATAPWHRFGYNIFCHHTVFNKPEIASIMPPDTFYITIVRNPTTLFESLYEYADLGLRYRQTFEEFVYRRIPGANISTDRAQGYLGVNQMAYDMGINPRLFDNASAVDSEIQRLNLQFDLVLMAEHFDQSMVLLADKLCWDLNDVTYFKHNSRKSKLTNLNGTTTERIEKLNSADVRIYRFFENVFQRQIEKYGGWAKLESAVQKLRRRNEELEKSCVHVKSDDSKKIVDPVFQSQKIEQFVVRSRNETCQLMAKHEIAFTRHLKLAQMMKVSRAVGVIGAGQHSKISPQLNVGEIGRPMVPNMWKQLSGELGFNPLFTYNNSQQPLN